jgi:hypothetical protein
VLYEILRRFDPEFRRTVRVVPAGDAKTIGRTVRVVRETHAAALVAVRDGDQGEALAEGLLKLPGGRPPEVELAESPEVQALLIEEYEVDLADVRAGEQNHHKWFKEVARRAAVPEMVVLTAAGKVYATTVDPVEGQRLVDLLKESIA